MTGKNKIIYADPPWSYRDKANSGKRGAGHKYKTMEKKDLAGMREFIDSLAAPDCVLFLWVTMPMLPNGLSLLSSWGFQFKTVAFTWVKTRSKGSLHWGMGNWTRANPEVCLLAVRGRPKRVSAAVHSVIQSELREHSRKPDETRDRIVQLLGDLPRIELFARQKAKGWESWGDQLQ